MKKTKKILSIFLAVLMIMSSFAFSSSAATYAGNTITGEVTKEIGETGTWHRLPRLTNICSCGGIITEDIAVQYYPNNITVSEEGIIDNIQCSIGTWPGNDLYNGLECFKLTYDAVKAGTVTLTLKLKYTYEADPVSGYHTCGRPVSLPANYNYYVDTVTFTINVVCPGHVDDNGDYYCDICEENMCPGHVDVNGDGKCDNCGVDTDAHKHVWGDGVITKNATCDETGSIKFTCVNCKLERTETLAKKCNGSCGCTKGVKKCDGTCAANCVCNEECDHANVTFTNNGNGTHDGVCNNCKAVVVDNEKHADSDKNNKCDKCGAKLSTTAPTDPADPTDPDHKHVDKDGDGYCDGCGHKLPIIDADCNCICHRRGKIWNIFYRLYLVVWKLFGIKSVCDCGNYHYSR